MSDGRCAVLVFTKTPIPGNVKSRLVPELGEARVTELYKSLIGRTLATAKRSGVGDTELWCWPTTDHPFLQECAAKFRIPLNTQQGDNLGERMHFAFDQQLPQYDQVLLIGCDCPVLTKHDLRTAVGNLRNGANVVLGPAEDGGYYLIGLRAACRDLFENIEWGGSSVLGTTRAIIDVLGLRCVELAERWDLDRPGDLSRYIDLPG